MTGQGAPESRDIRRGDHNTRVAIGIDVGGTKIAGALVDADGRVITEHVVPTPRSSTGADPGAVATRNLIGRLLEGDRGDDRWAAAPPEGIGLGVPEYVTPDGRIASSEVLDWPHDAIQNASVDGTEVPVMIEADVRCAALAELRAGHGRTSGPDPAPDSFLFVTIGTGISHTMVIDGKLWPGHRGEALALGELASRPELAIRLDAPRTVEQQASGLALEKALADAAPTGRPGSAGTGRRSREPVAESIRTAAGQMAAEALMAAVHLLDPEVVVLGGGLGTSDGTYTAALHAHYRELASVRPGAPPILCSKLGNRGGVVGAALAVFVERDRAERSSRG